MNDKNALKGASLHEEVDINLFPKDPTDYRSEHYRSFDLTHSNQSSENRARCDSINLLKETLNAIPPSEAFPRKKPAKLRTGIPKSPSQDDLLGLNFQLEIPKKTLTVPQQTIHRHSVSLPVTPQTSPKVERKTGGLLRKLSGTNLMQMGVVPEHSSNLSVSQMDKNDNNAVARRDSQMKSANTKDFVDSASVSARSSQSQPAGGSWLVNTGFGNWLKKKTNLDNKEMNAMAPSF